MIVLGIESTCDETACAIVKDGHVILANVITSQIDLHAQYGGVFPELACRRHIDTIIPVINTALQNAKMTPQEIDLIAVAKGPGLIGALLIGLNVAKALSFAWNIPFIGINHVEAHIYAAMMDNKSPRLPALGVVISGGHTLLIQIHELGKYTLIGTTIDDAIGESFDKVAAMLGLPYPGGPAIEMLAKQGNPAAVTFKTCKTQNNPWDFSFSGLKTQVLYKVKGPNACKLAPLIISENQKQDIAAAFQETALNDIVNKSISAAQAFGCQSIYIGGGVSNNQRLKELFLIPQIAYGLSIHFPPSALSSDNAAMIAGLGYYCFKRQGYGDPLSLEPMTRIPFTR